MRNVRVIARLDVKGPNLVKGIHLEGLRVLGKPADFARHYAATGADELLFVDVVASLYERNSLHDIVRETARDIFVPITVAGGLRTIADVRAVLRAGADKVAINTAAVRRCEFVEQAAREFGNSTIVGTIEAIRQPDGRYFAFIDNGREQTGLEVRAWAQQLQGLGVGEILVTSVDREGSGRGFDLELINLVAEAVTVPVIAHGGPGRVEDVEAAVATTRLSAVAVASLIHNDTLDKMQSGVIQVSAANEAEGNREFLKRRTQLGRIGRASIHDIKRSLVRHRVQVRIEEANSHG